MDIVVGCYKCGKPPGMGVTLISVFAPGTYYMCTDCIAKEEKETGKVPMFSMATGLVFMTKEEAEDALKENSAQENDGWDYNEEFIE